MSNYLKFLPTQDEINSVIDWSAKSEEEGSSKYPGMTYEQGVRAALEWINGYGENPSDE